MTPSPYDFVPGFDPTGQSSITFAQLFQMVQQAVPNTDRGIILYGNSSPDLTGLDRLTRYIWIDTSDDHYSIKSYMPDHPSGPGWYSGALSAGSILTAQIGDGQVTLPKLSISGGSALQIARINAGGTAWEFIDTPASPSDPDEGMTFGQEYMYYFQSRITAGYNPKITFSGDSTTEGAGLSDTQNRLDQDFLSSYLRMFKGCTVVNAGHSAKTIHDWLISYYATDLAGTPDLYIVRWGLNPNLVSDFETDLRAGLTAIRASKTAAQMSILLMVPNCANDLAHSRTNTYVDTLTAIIRRAARDFQCGFIDTVDIFRKAYDVPGMMNYSDSLYVHPGDQFNLMIGSKIMDFVIGSNIPRHYGHTYVVNPDSTTQTKTASSAPNTFYGAIQLHRATIANGWPLDGNVFTFKQSDGVVIQHNYDWANGRGDCYIRMGSGAVWKNWLMGSYTNPPLATSVPPTNAALPNTYSKGISQFVVLASDSWPGDGHVTMFYQWDGNAFQIFNKSDGSKIAFRCFKTAAAAWTDWYPLAYMISTGIPTITAGASGVIGTGGSPSATLNAGTEQAGKLTVVTGSSGTGAGVLATITAAVAGSYALGCYPTLTPGNAATAAEMTKFYISTADNDKFVISVASALTTSTTYVLYFSTGSFVNRVY